MKVAVLSDIQGNATALRTVLDEITHHKVDSLISLGDVATGAQPAEVLNLLREHNFLTIMGNMDQALLNPVQQIPDDLTERKYAEIDLWCLAQLSQEDRAYIHNFKTNCLIEVDRLRLFCCHAAPESFEAVLDHTTPEARLQPIFAAHRSDIVAVGHMHDPLLRTLEDNRILLNPGSIGLPNPLPSTGKRPLLARFAIVTASHARWSITIHTIAYDAQRFERELLASGMPHAAWYRAQWDV